MEGARWTLKKKPIKKIRCEYRAQKKSPRRKSGHEETALNSGSILNTKKIPLNLAAKQKPPCFDEFASKPNNRNNAEILTPVYDGMENFALALCAF